MKKIVTILFTLILLSSTIAQQHTLKVEDEEHHSLLADINIIYLGDHLGYEKHLHTDTSGSVEIPFEERAMLEIHSAFHHDTTLFIDGKHNYTITLHDEVLTGAEAVITAQYCHTTTENAVHKIKVIDAEQIEKRGAVNLKDVLATEMNIRLEQDNILGTGITMQGLDGENVKILVDGVPLIGRLDGNLDLTQINLDNIERIEVVEGPLSVSYGTNALAGTINLITKKTSSETLQLHLTTYYESIGQYNVSGRIAKQIKGQALSLSGGRNFFDGYSEQDTSRFLQWKPKEQYFANFQYKTVVKDVYFRLNNDFFKEKITNRGAERAPYYNTAFDDYYHTFRNNTSLFLKWFINDNWTFFNTLNYSYYQRQKDNFFKDLTTLEETRTGAENQDTSVFDLIMARGTLTRSTDSSHFNYQLGYDINIESTYGERIVDNTQSIRDYAVFASAEYAPAQHITIRPGLRYAHNSKYKAPLIPSLNIRYRLGKSATLRLSYGRGFRAPSLKELYMNFVDLNHDIQGNPDLKAETTDAYQIHYTTGDTLLSLPIKFELSTFYNNLSNKIDILQADDNGMYEYINVGKNKTAGVQTSANVVVHDDYKFSIGGNYTGRYNQLSDTTEANSFSFSPELQASLTRDFAKQKLSVSIFYKYTGRLPNYFLNDEAEIEQGFMDAYSMSNLTVSKQLFKDHVSLSCGIKNLFNVVNVRTSGNSGGAHSSSSDNTSVAWSRSFFVSLKYKM